MRLKQQGEQPTSCVLPSHGRWDGLLAGAIPTNLTAHRVLDFNDRNDEMTIKLPPSVNNVAPDVVVLGFR